MTLTTEVIMVTPDIATAWLTTNTKNRPVSSTTVKRYSEDMASGNWKLTGESIIFGSDGVLLDGQHRLHAVIKSGTPAEFLVVGGPDPSVFSVIDQGMNRTATNVFTMAKLAGDKSATNSRAVSALRAYLSLVEPNPMFGKKYSIPKVLEAWEKHPELAVLMEAFPDDFICSDAVILASGMLFVKKHTEMAFAFLKELASYSDTDKDTSSESPTHWLYWTLFARSKDGKANGSHNRRFIAAVIVKAWNAYLMGDPIRRNISFARDARFPEALEP